MPIEILWLPVVLAAVMEFLDASMGMSYGEITVLLLFLGFSPLQAVPAVVLTSAVLSLTAGVLHDWAGNVDFSFGTTENRAVILLMGFGLVGMAIGVFTAVRLPETIWKLYIGLLVAALGVALLITERKDIAFSWNRLRAMGAFAAFNKGMSGGGYGPVLTSGQILSGMDSKHAVGITALAEGVVSLAGAALFFYIGGPSYFHPSLIASLLLGGLIATPIAVAYVRWEESHDLRDFIGVVSILLGLAYLASVFI